MADPVVGRSLTRLDAPDKATGRTIFGADVVLPGMLRGRALRSKLPHARILHIDTSRAEALPGVMAVVTARDAPPEKVGIMIDDQPFLAREKVRYAGEPVAAVAAVDEETAASALELIRVEWEELPAVLDPLEAMQPGAPIVHEGLETYPCTFPCRRQGNILNQVSLQRGDVQQALAAAHLVLERRYTTQREYQGHLEYHHSLAAVDGSGRITVWTSTQGPFGIRDLLARGLRLPMSRLRVIGTAVGGAFGGKGLVFNEAIALLLALKSGRPVKVSSSVQEELSCAPFRHPAIMDLVTGVDREGRLLAVRGRYVLDTGAYSELGVFQATKAMGLQGPYRVPNVDIQGFAVYTNNPTSGAVRAPGMPQALFAIESQMDLLARELGLDPLELRLRNGVVEGDPWPGAPASGGPPLRNVGLGETLRQVAQRLEEVGRPLGRNQGRGIACGQWSVSPGGPGTASSACVKINEDGSAVLLTGAMEVGGGQNTVLAQIAAQELGLELAEVSLVAADTDSTPYEFLTGGSQATYRAGTSVRAAAADARQQLLKLAAEKLEARLEDLELRDKAVSVRGSPERSVPIAALAAAAQHSQAGPILGTSGHWKEQATPPADPTVDAPAYATHAVDVEVDPETGNVRLLRYLASHDVGFAINPMNVEGQVEGGVVFGQGYALGEEIVLEKGQGRQRTLSDYRLPTALDTVMVETGLVEKPSGRGPFGAKGIGEPPTVPVAAAIANAIHDAVGVRITELPITPEKVLRALRENNHP